MNDLVAHGIPLANTDVNPVGTITAFAGINPPSNLYMICDGRTLNVSDNPELFSVIGYTYGGSGDTFYIPDMRGRMPVGMSTSDVDFNEVGKSGGFKEVVLTENQIASHTHLQNAHSHTSPSHTHTQDQHTHTNSAHTHSGTTGYQSNSHYHTGTTGNDSVSHTHSWSGTTSQHGGHSHEQFVTANGSSGSGTREDYNRDSKNAQSYSQGTTTGWGGQHTHTVSGTTGGVSTRHTHTFTTSEMVNSHNHTFTTGGSTISMEPVAALIKGTSTTIDETAAINLPSGGGMGHNNMSPYLTLNFIIKVR